MCLCIYIYILYIYIYIYIYITHLHAQCASLPVSAYVPRAHVRMHHSIPSLVGLRSNSSHCTQVSRQYKGTYQASSMRVTKREQIQQLLVLHVKPWTHAHTTPTTKLLTHAHDATHRRRSAQQRKLRLRLRRKKRRSARPRRRRRRKVKGTPKRARREMATETETATATVMTTTATGRPTEMEMRMETGMATARWAGSRA